MSTEGRPPSSPHIHDRSSVPATMHRVLLALLPGAALYTLFFGWAVVVQILIAATSALLLEALVLRFRGRAAGPALSDCSSVVAAALFALSISPFASWWLGCIGMAFAIVVVKHLYGGLGYNLFNPAMSAYLFVWLCFPLQFVHWPGAAVDEAAGLVASLAIIFADSSAIDTLSGATALSHVKLELSKMMMWSELADPEIYGLLGGRRWEWINVAFALGGVGLVLTRTIDWRLPLALLCALLLVSGAFHLYDAERHASPLFHLFSGGTLLCAFFIATEPVSGTATSMGRWVYGAGIGLLIYLLRAAGNFADGVALAVVLMNCAAPFIDHCCRPQRWAQNGE